MLLLVCVAGWGFGCAGSNATSTPSSRQLKPSDFTESNRTQAQPSGRAAEPATSTEILTVTDPPTGSTTVSTSEQSAAATHRQDDATGAPSTPASVNSGSGGSLVTGGMVGQVNGQPIYSKEVLDPLSEMLTTMGRQQTRDAFRRRLVRPMQDGTRVIPDRLWAIVMNTLILAEAERDMTDQDQFRLRNILKEKKEELLRQALGSVTIANVRTRERTGRGLKEELAEQRKAIIVNRYVHQKLWPKVDVTRRDIERYYLAHPDEFNEPPGRKIRMIRTSSPRNAERIDELLASGEPFVDVATMPLNETNRESGGLHSERASGDRIFGIEPLNEAVLRLAEGEHSPRITVGDKYAWLFVERIHPGSQVTLQDGQQSIKERLQRMEYTQLFNEYRDKLRREGSFTPVEQMTAVMVDVATSLYAVGP